MGLNISKGNMYEFVTHTWNVIKGKCFHDCDYCYMKRWGDLKPIRLDKKELKTDLGKGNFIFVGSSNDMFAEKVHDAWIEIVIEHCKKFDNKYLLQTKNPKRFLDFDLPDNFILGTTIETNRVYPEMGNTPTPHERASALGDLFHEKFITIEPIMDFDVFELFGLIEYAGVDWVNIGADSGKKGLTEPSERKIKALISLLQKDSSVIIKKNLKRIN